MCACTHHAARLQLTALSRPSDTGAASSIDAASCMSQSSQHRLSANLAWGDSTNTPVIWVAIPSHDQHFINEWKAQQQVQQHSGKSRGN
jgi:hypothetical protein